MRKESLVAKIGQHVEFSDNFTMRDERVVKKIAKRIARYTREGRNVIRDIEKLKY